MVTTWIDDVEEEAMEEGHLATWAQLITLSGEKDLSSSRVLDFGCNRGGFLRLLHERLPFREGIGIDVVPGSVDVAMQRRGMLPVTYLVCPNVASLPLTFDVAFSHDVVYLLPHLGKHARAIASVLKPAGRYHLALSCHTANPLWPRWKNLLRSRIAGRMYDYSPAAIEARLIAAGFTVTCRPLNLEVPRISSPQQLEPWFPTEEDLQDYYRNHFLLFSATLRQC